MIKDVRPKEMVSIMEEIKVKADIANMPTVTAFVNERLEAVSVERKISQITDMKVKREMSPSGWRSHRIRVWSR